MNVYWAAPFFDEAWSRFNRECAERLSALGMNVVLPQNETFNRHESEPTAEEVFDVDYTRIRRSDLVVACIDGLAIDDGVAVELGLAFASEKPCIGYITDLRWSRVGPGRLYRNLMVTGLLLRSGGLAQSWEELEALIQQARLT